MIDLTSIRQRDPRLDRTKLVPVSTSALLRLLTLDGSQIITADGLPHDGKAEIVSWMISPNDANELWLLVYHPTFAVLPRDVDVQQLVVSFKVEEREASDGATDSEAT